MGTYRGFEIKNRKGLNHWDVLLEEWLVSVERYCRIMKGEDAPYIYNERANISLLSGAAWKSGRIALEEYQSEKGYRNKSKRYGRADLWISSDTEEEVIEAKFKWICMDSSGSDRIIEDTMANARNDAKKTKASSVVRAVGVSFFPLYKKLTNIDDIDSLITQTINEFLNRDYHALAWCFPKEMRSDESDAGNIRPGIVLMANNIDY